MRPAETEFGFRSLPRSLRRWAAWPGGGASLSPATRSRRPSGPPAGKRWRGGRAVSNIVDVVVLRLRKKLGRELITTLRGQGFIIDG